MADQIALNYGGGFGENSGRLSQRIDESLRCRHPYLQ
jgi:hypothetical protein